MVSLIDQKIGDIVKAIDEGGWGNNTWFFFTADHGEMLGDHKLMYKSVFYKGSVLVPNIIRPAEGLPARTVAGPIESIDITATVLDAAGAALPQCQGRSLVPLLHGQGLREVAYSELAGHQNKGNYFVMAATQRTATSTTRRTTSPASCSTWRRTPTSCTTWSTSRARSASARIFTKITCCHS